MLEPCQAEILRTGRSGGAGQAPEKGSDHIATGGRGGTAHRRAVRDQRGINGVAPEQR